MSAREEARRLWDGLNEEQRSYVLLIGGVLGVTLLVAIMVQPIILVVPAFFIAMDRLWR